MNIATIPMQQKLIITHLYTLFTDCWRTAAWNRQQKC